MELVHHGIKGQSWGVRNGPPYPLNKHGSRRKINVGTELSRYSTRPENSIRDTTYAFSSGSKHDTKTYKEDLINGKLGVASNEVRDVYKIQIKAIKPSIILEGHKVVKEVVNASKDEEMLKLYNQLKTGGFFKGVLSANQRADIADSNKDLNSARVELAKKIHTQVYKNRYNFVENYRKRGYDAIVDPEDYVYIYDDPLILVNPSNFKISDIKKV